MKRLLCSTIIALACLLPAGAVFTACQSPTAQRTAANTLFTTGKGVDAAYRTYLDLVIAGQLPTNSVPRIAKQYSEFQSAFNLALISVTFNTNAVAPSALIAQAVTLTTQLEAAKKGIQP
jgi:chaperone required for assembly of F1-ATPase